MNRIAPVAVALLPFAYAAPGYADDAAALIDRHAPAIIAIREALHANPELSNRETATAKRIAAHLDALGLDVTTGVAHTGVVALLRGGRPGPVVAVRADMDALPVTEASGLPFASTVTTDYQGQTVGVAHACGHDIHMAVQLGVATVLAGMRDTLPGTVKFIFQPAEEGAPPGEDGGASMMVREGVLEDPVPEVVFGLHTTPQHEVGKVGWISGPAMASADRFTVAIRGKQSHGAWPHLGVDPVVTAAEAIVALQTVVSRSIDPLEPAVLTVGTIRGGERFNIIPGEVRMQGTVRTFSRDVQDRIEQRMNEVLGGITAAAGASYTLDYERVTPAVHNDPELAAWSRQVLQTAVGAGNVVDVEPVMGAEDFAVYAERVPGFFMWLGVVAPGTTSGGLHTPEYRADNSAVPAGMRAMTALVLARLNR